MQLGIHILALQLPVDNQHLRDDNLQTCFSKLAMAELWSRDMVYSVLCTCVMPRCNYSDCSMYKFLDELGTSMQPSHQWTAVDFLSFCNVYSSAGWYLKVVALLKMTTCRHCNYISGIIMKQEQGGTHATINTIWEQRGTEMSRPYSDIIENRLFLAAAPTWALAPRLAKQSLYWRLTAAEALC